MTWCGGSLMIILILINRSDRHHPRPRGRHWAGRGACGEAGHGEQGARHQLGGVRGLGEVSVIGSRAVPDSEAIDSGGHSAVSSELVVEGEGHSSLVVPDSCSMQQGGCSVARGHRAQLTLSCPLSLPVTRLAPDLSKRWLVPYPRDS